jgi:rubredoxin
MIIEILGLLCSINHWIFEVFMGMECYVCGVCGHKYNPEKGEPLQNLAAGMPFEDLPADWTCPVCFAAKGEFQKE